MVPIIVCIFVIMNIEILRQFINGNHTSGYFDAGFLTFNYEVVDVWERSAGGRVFFKYNIDVWDIKFYNGDVVNGTSLHHHIINTIRQSQLHYEISWIHTLFGYGDLYGKIGIISIKDEY